jgi:hypothetical protein
MNANSSRRGRRFLARTTTSVAICAAALAGCGGSDDTSSTTSDAKAADESSVRNVLAQLQQASVAGQGNRICNEIFTPKLADSVTQSAKSGSCAKEVKKNLFSPTTRLTVQDVKVTDAANATATIKEANGNVSTVFLVRQGGIWRIRAVQPA